MAKIKKIKISQKKAVVKKLKKVLAVKKVSASQKKQPLKKNISKKNLPTKRLADRKVFAKKPTKKSTAVTKRKAVKAPAGKKGVAVKQSPSAKKKSNTHSEKKSSELKKISLPPIEDVQIGSFFKAKIKVIGLGGGGSSIVSEIGRSLPKATFVVADTDVRAFKKTSGIKNFLFGKELTHGLGTGLNPDLAMAAAQQQKEEIAKLFEGQDIVIFIASLGGGVGSGATKVFAEVAKNFDGITFGIFTLPFKFEGSNKFRIASKALKELRDLLNVSVTIPNERIFKVIDANTPITQAFSMVNRKLIDSLESLMDLIYSPGIINIDFADLKAILRGKGNLAFLNTAEASGKDRAEKVVKDILNNPLYQNHNFTAEKILFNIAGSANLSMFEVDKISRAISSQNPKAKIIFGISKSQRHKNKIKTTLLMTGPALGAELHDEPSESAGQADSKKESKKPKKPSKKQSKNNQGSGNKETAERKVMDSESLIPAFVNESVDLGLRRLSVVEIEQKPKRTIRRSALDIKQAQEQEEQEKSLQEKEWEIPAFLRKVKFKS